MSDDKWNVKKFAERARAKRLRAQMTGDLSILAQPEPHYHVEYNAKADMTEGYETPTLASRKMSQIADSYLQKGGDEAVVFYEEGLIQIREAKIAGRTGTFPVMMQVVECPFACKNILKVHSRN